MAKDKSIQGAKRWDSCIIVRGVVKHKVAQLLWKYVVSGRVRNLYIAQLLFRNDADVRYEDLL
jgi:hypothetical protein